MKTLVVIFTVALLSVLNLLSGKEDVLGGSAGGSWQAPVTDLSDVPVQFGAHPSAVIINGKPAYFYNKGRALEFAYADTKHVIENTYTSNKYWIKQQGDNIYLFWWVKNGADKKGKELYFRGSNDLGENFGERIKINTDYGVLPNLSIVTKESGELVVAYIDERKPSYGIYLNVSSDYGATWRKEDIRLDKEIIAKNEEAEERSLGAYAVDPNLQWVENDELVITWQQRYVDYSDKTIRNHFVASTSKDKGITWGEAAVIFGKPTSQTYEYALSYSKGNLFVTVADPEEGLVGIVRSSDKKWKNIGVVPGTQKVGEISYLKTAANNKMFKVSYIKKQTSHSKYSVEVATYRFDEDAWDSKVVRLDRGKVSQEETKAMYQDIVTLPNNEFVAVWEDFRSLIPSLYMDYTIKQGEHWQIKPFPITREGYREARLPSLISSKNDLWVFASGYVVNDMGMPPRYEYQRMTVGEENALADFVAPPSPDLAKKEVEKVLLGKVDKLMKARINEEWTEEWKLFDPMLRRMRNKQEWIRTRGKINTLKYSVNDVTIDDNIAHVQLSIEYIMPMQVIRGQQMDTSDVKKGGVKLRWTKFYNEWYFSPNNLMAPHLNY